VTLTTRFNDALVFAAQVHALQTRKGSDTPYISHLIGVASIVLEYGADEDTAIAALLHDVVEDQDVTLDDIRGLFGERVASIVEEVTETDENPKPPWKERKDKYIAHISEASDEALLVAAADKLYNLRTMCKNRLEEGWDFWKKFRSSPMEQIWFYESVAQAIATTGRCPHLLTREMFRALFDVKDIVVLYKDDTVR
jgi:GTP pyrophosphokinase